MSQAVEYGNDQLPLKQVDARQAELIAESEPSKHRLPGTKKGRKRPRTAKSKNRQAKAQEMTFGEREVQKKGRKKTSEDELRERVEKLENLLQNTINGDLTV